MRNIFDQYDQQENKLTHALICTLANDKRLIPRFLRWLKCTNIPSLKNIHIGQQQSPGREAKVEKEGAGSIPDACFFDDDGWALAIESKVQAEIDFDQLLDHRRTSARYGYEKAYVVLIAVECPLKPLPNGMHYVQWKEVYQWFVEHTKESEWAGRFVEYMQVLEANMIAKDYHIRGTLTMFSGFHFDEEHPYTYHEGKRLIRLIGQEFRKNKRLVRELGLDPEEQGRAKITMGEGGAVWDFIPLKEAKGATSTAYPQATMGIKPNNVSVAITVPDKLKGGIKRRLKKVSKDDFGEMLAKIEKNLRRCIKKDSGIKPIIYISQRYYKSQRSHPIIDGHLEVDLRTLIDNEKTGMKHQPKWLDAIYNILIHKRTNIQFGIQIRFPYSEKDMHSAKALDVMAEAWIAMKPMLDFVLK